MVLLVLLGYLGVSFDDNSTALAICYYPFASQKAPGVLSLCLSLGRAYYSRHAVQQTVRTCKYFCYQFNVLAATFNGQPNYNAVYRK